METIQFEAKLSKIDSMTIIQLPKTASDKLPSRGMKMVEGTINGKKIIIPLEPDGKMSHWFQVDEAMLKAIKAKIGDTITIEMKPTKDWPEPLISEDLETALENSPEINALFMNITPAARWDWIRWIRATNNPETRKKRIEVAFSKLKGGSRRPCCFNRSMCTDFTVSKNGILRDSA